MNKSPAFQFYPEQWLSSRRIAIMTAEQEGIYIRLLCYCWDSGDCSIPDDDDQLLAMARIFKGGSTNVLPAVKACFMPHPKKPGFLTHERLVKEIEKQTLWREKSARGGKQAQENKRNSKGGSTKGRHSVSVSVSVSGKKEKELLRSNSKKKIGFEDLTIDHIAVWLNGKRATGKYLTIDEHALLEKFKDYCRSKNPKYSDYLAAFRNSFGWANAPTKGNHNGTYPKQLTKAERLDAALDRGIAILEANDRAEALAIEGPDPAML